jgi:hypothetical protein
MATNNYALEDWLRNAYQDYASSLSSGDTVYQPMPYDQFAAQQLGWSGIDPKNLGGLQYSVNEYGPKGDSYAENISDPSGKSLAQRQYEAEKFKPMDIVKGIGFVASMGSGFGALGAAAGGGAAGAGLAEGAGAGLGGAAEGMTADQLFEQAAQQALQTSGNYYAQSLPAQLAMDAGNAAALTDGLGGGTGGGLLDAGGNSGNSLVQSQNNTFLDKLQNGALKGGAKGGITSAIQGKNPLKGALTGAVGGAIGGGISSIGDGSLGNAMSLDSGGGDMGLVPGGFDVPADAGGVLNNVGSNTGGGMDWWDIFSGGGSPVVDPGSFGDTPIDWSSANWGDLTNASAGQNLGNFSDPGTDWNWFTGDPADYSNEGRNYSGPGGLDPATNSPVNSGSTDWLQSLLGGAKGLIGGASSAVGGGQNLAALIGAGLGAASGGGTETSRRTAGPTCSRHGNSPPRWRR